MNAVVEKKPQVTVNVTVQKIKDWLALQETQGQFLLSIGALSQEQYDRGDHQLKDYLVKVQKDPEVARSADQDPVRGFQQAEGVENIGDPDTTEALREATIRPEDDDFDCDGFLAAMGFGGSYEDDEE